MARTPLAAALLGLWASALVGGCAPAEDGGPSEPSSRVVERVARGLLALAAQTSAASDEFGSEAGSQETTTHVYYRYTDETGAIRFVQDLDMVPPDQRNGARIEWESRARQATERRAPAPRRRSLPGFRAERPDLAVASAPSRGAEVVVYTTSWCGWCRKTLAHLDRKGVPYVNKDIEKDPGAANELRRKTGSTAIPVIEVDGELVRGFDRDRIDQLLEGI
jgi:glutaredoxin-like YruB-family protein